MIGNTLKRLRKEKGIEAQFIANAIGVTKATYSGYENNKFMPKTEILIQLAKFFNVSTDYLLGITDKSNKRLTEKEADQLADEIMEIYIQKGKLKRGEVLTPEKRNKILKEIEAFIDMSNKLGDI